MAGTYQFSGGRGHDGGRDSYRPGAPERFTFRAPYGNGNNRTAPSSAHREARQPQLPLYSQDHGRDGEGTWHAWRDSRPRPPTGPSDRHRQNKPYGKKPFHPAPATANRPLLRAQRGSTPEQMLGMSNEQVRFKDVDDLSDSEEAEMEIGTDIEVSDGGDDADERPTKRQKVVEASRWSNPDPYTALPPPDVSRAKRKDMVQLIRKAKIGPEQNKSMVANGEDFISFDNFGDKSERKKDGSASEDDHVVLLHSNSSTKAHPQPTFSHLNTLHPDRLTQTVSSHDAFEPPPPPPPGTSDNMDPGRASKPRSYGVTVDQWPPPPPLVPPPAPLKGRKRGREEFSEQTTNMQELFAGSGNDKQARRGKAKGDVVAEWRSRDSATAIPWCTSDHSKVEHVGIRLHKEIADFYHYVKPQTYEQEIRMRLVGRVKDFLGRCYANAEVGFFGSFAAGLYLPNADMDLVVLSRNYKNGGYPELGQSKKHLYKFAKDLTNCMIARPGSTVVIAGAKVPLVKYIDSKTGLKVDISFENETGLEANMTYKKWKEQYPAMPIIVTMIKQFLMMRGLHEVFTGGLGGFGVTCMVVSLFQHMPQIQSRNMDPMQNLGEVLMSFLDFYGNKLNTTTTGIRMSPPGYFPKVCTSPRYISKSHGIQQQAAPGAAAQIQPSEAVGTLYHRPESR